jgi:hypothetical protein
MMEHPEEFNRILDAWYDARGFALLPAADAHRL